MITADQIIQLLGLVFMAGCVYSAIRVDIKNIYKEVGEVKGEVAKTHSRIDDHVQLHLEGKI